MASASLYVFLLFVACFLYTQAQQLTVRNPIPNLNVPPCGYLEYRIPANTFYDDIDGDTRNLNLTLRNSSGILSREYWVNLETKNQTIIALVHDMLLLNTLKPPSEFNFVLTATTKRGASISTNVRLRVSEPTSNITVSFSLTFVWYSSSNPATAIILKRVLDNFAAYFHVSPMVLRYTAVYSDKIGYSVGITNCTQPEKSCDHALISRIQSKLYNSVGTLPAFKNAMFPDVFVSFVQVSLVGACLKQTRPIVVKSYPTVTVNACSNFRIFLPNKVFYDEDDGFALRLSVYAINGKVIPYSQLWVDINTAENSVYGLITDHVISEQPTDGYNLTVRAYDTSYYHADAPLMLRIDKAPLKKYYQFTLYLTLNPSSFLYDVIEQFFVVNSTNNFFNRKDTNVISWKKLGGKSVSVTSSICSLSQRCDNTAATNIFNQMVLSGNTPRSDFAKAFLPRYTLIAVTTFTDPICKQPMEPPVPLVNPWYVSASHCGKLQVEIPAALFNDPQDGNARNLKIEMFTSDDKPLSKTSWVQMNSSSQVIRGMPTIPDINVNKEYKLVATDRSGLNGTLKVRFLFSTPRPTKYVYKFIYRVNNVWPNFVEEVSAFLRRIRHYLNDTSTASFGLVKYSAETSTVTSLDYENCSIAYNPCDVSMHEKIKSLLFKSSQATTGLRDALAPEFTIVYGTTENKDACIPGGNTPPKVVVGLPVLNISVCGIFKFTIPSSMFNDAEDGGTRNLSLLIRDSMKKPLTSRYWLEFDTTTQEITSFATVRYAELNTRYSFILSATDKGGLYVPYSLHVDLIGPFAVLKKCQIHVVFTADASLKQKSDVYLASKVMQSMVSYFSLSSSSEIGVIHFVRHSETSFSFYWSYCSPKYTHSTSSMSSNIAPDIQGLSIKILKKLFIPGTSEVQSAFKAAFSQLVVTSVKKIFTAECSNIPPIPGVDQTLVLNVSSCGYTKVAVDRNWFYDAEDGDAHSLKLDLLDETRTKISDVENWINIDINSMHILMSVQDSQRDSAKRSYTFYLKATDSSGKSAEIRIVLNLIDRKSQPSPFSVQFQFLLTQRVHYLNDSLHISDAIAGIYSLPKGSEIMIKSFREGNGLFNSATFYWSTCSYYSCQSDFLKKTKDTLNSVSFFNSYKQNFLPKFDLQRYSLSYVCSRPIIPPETRIKTLILNISMCSVWTYNIPPSMFFDSTDGNARKMAIHLLDSSKKHVSASSWIQLNTASLKLYSIPSSDSKLYKSPSSLYLQATNSVGGKSYASVIVNVLETPYTNNCPVTLTVQRKFGTSHTVDLSVLNRLIRLISNFYQDSEARIKVLKFAKLSTYVYSLKYSNCSFAFATKQAAQRGHDESQRTMISAMFSMIMNSDRSVQSSFTTYLSEYFTVTNVNVSYECIEAPPYPTGATSRRSYASVCTEFRDLLSTTLFNDKKDGTNLQYSLTYNSGKAISPNDWLTYDAKKHEVYGMVTADVKKNAPFYGYEYLIVATDSSGRSANISYAVKITNTLPHLNVKFTLGFTSKVGERESSAAALVNISRSISVYLSGDNTASKVLIHSYKPWKSLVFEYCSMPCTEVEYMKKANMLQKTVYKSEPALQFINAVQDMFVPTYINMYGPTCLPSSSVRITIYRTITLNNNVCGFVDYKIPSNSFTDSEGRTATDFLLSMYQDGHELTKLNTAQFDSANQQFSAMIITSQLQSSAVYELKAQHPVSGRSSSSPFTIKFPDYEKFKLVSSTLCVVNVQLSTTINPAYSDTYILKKFSEITARYLGDVSQHIQIESYTRSSSYPILFSISFSNCSWYSMLNSISSQSSASVYTSSLSITLSRLLTKSQSNSFAYNSQYHKVLHEEFKLLSISANSWCYKQPNMPPKVNITISVITVIQCTGFSYKIPAYSFSDEDGNTRNLALQLYDNIGKALGSSNWVSFNTVSQTIHGTPTRQAYLAQNQTGYKFILKAADRYGLSKEIDIFIKISGTISAPSNEPPTIILKNYEVMIPNCGIFRQKLPDGFATDKEDGTLRNLSVSMKLHDGSDIPVNSWIQFDSKTHEIVTLPSNDITSSASGMKWSYKIIVSDSCGGMASTFIGVSTQNIHTSYYNHEFTFQSLMANSALNLFIQETFLRKTAEFFKQSSKQYRVINFKKESTDKQFTLIFSNCSITEYICPYLHQEITSLQNTFLSSSQNLHSFSSFMSTWFKIISYKNQTFYHVEKSPSLITSSATDIRVTSCGKYSRDISSSVFNHRAQSSLNFSLSLANGNPIPTTYPIQLINKILYVISLGSGSSGSHTVKLTAIDLCGQSSSTLITININVPPKPVGYGLKFESSVQTSFSSVYYVLKFTEALQAHINNPFYNVYISSYSRIQNTVTFFWTSCSESVCNKTDVVDLRKIVFSHGQITDQVLISRLNNTFTNPQITEDNHCNFTSPKKPVSNGSLEISVDLCKKLSFKVPLNAFYDHEDGDSSTLHLSLLTDKNQILPIDNWIQLNRLTHTIYGYPRFSSTTTLQRVFRYNLVAKDIKQNHASSAVTASITGTLPTITYKLTMYGTITSTHTQPHIDYEIDLIQKIGRFFGDYAINDISFTKEGQSFSFSWSFCKMRVDKCDCYYIKRVETMLNPIYNFQQAMQPSFVVSHINSVRLGVCKHPGGPKVLIDKTEISVFAGQTFSYVIRNNHFYDHEDGYTQNLTLFISNYQKEKMTSSSWIKVQNQHICGLALLSQVQSKEWSTTRHEYHLVARDACGMESTDSFSVRMTSYRQTLSYKIRIYLTDYLSNLQTSCYKMQTFIYKISTYLNVNSSVIYIYDIVPSNSSYDNTTIVTWSMTNFTEKNCKNETVRVVRDKFVYENGTVNPVFVSHMKSDFHVVKVDDDNSSCILAPLPLVIPPFRFPIWILILLLILAILFLLCCLCWIFIPRCCTPCCAACLNGCCGCCNACCAKCCLPGGKYASLDSKSVPGMESGVLSDSKAAPLVNDDKLGKEGDPEGGVLAAPGLPDSSGYESSPDASKVDEDEMQMAPAAAPMAYTQPDFDASADEMNRGLDNQSENSLLPSTEASDEPNDFDSGVAAMPRGEPEAIAAMAPTYADEFSSVASMDDSSDGGVLARPLVDDEEMMQRSDVEKSFQQNNYTNFDNLMLPTQSQDQFAAPLSQEPVQAASLALPQTPNIYSSDAARRVPRERISVTTNEFQSNPIASNETITRSQNVEQGRRFSLVQPVNLFPAEQAPITSDDINLTESSSIQEVSQTRRASIPMIVESTTESKPSMAQLSKRRSSRVMIIGNDFDDYDDDDDDQEENAGDGQVMTSFLEPQDNSIIRVRRTSQSNAYSTNNGSRNSIGTAEQFRNESQLQSAPTQLRLMDDRSAPQYSPQDNVSSGRRVSLVRLSDRNDFNNQSAPMQLRLVDNSAASQLSSQDGRSQASRQGGRRISIVSKDGTVTELKNVKIVDKKNSSRRSSNATIDSMRDPYATDPEQRNVVKVRRVSLSSRRSSYADDYNDRNYASDGGRLSRSSLSLKDSRSNLHGYESDSTDSGYAITRGSQRQKHREVQSRYFDNPSGYEQERLASNNRRTGQNVRRVSREHRRTSHGIRRNSRDVRRNSRDVEMWSNTPSFRNQGYESDSYV